MSKKKSTIYKLAKYSLLILLIFFIPNQVLIFSKDKSIISNIIFPIIGITLFLFILYGYLTFGKDKKEPLFTYLIYIIALLALSFSIYGIWISALGYEITEKFPKVPSLLLFVFLEILSLIISIYLIKFSKYQPILKKIGVLGIIYSILETSTLLISLLDYETLLSNPSIFATLTMFYYVSASFINIILNFIITIMGFLFFSILVKKER